MELLLKTATLENLQDRALNGQVNEYRSLYWKIFLNYIPPQQPDKWPQLLLAARTKYDSLRKKYIFDPATAAQGARDWSLNNPLSLDEESPWKQYFEDVDLQKLIRQDVERTFPDHAFFRDEAIQNIMTDILFIWCKLNADVSYRQGMHEILAPILFVIHQDRLEEYNSDPLKTALFSPVHVEHDAWVLYEKVMKAAKTWYETVEDGHSGRISSSSNSSRKYMEKISNAKKMIPVVALCKRIQGELLRSMDIELCFHLERVGVEPQLYGIRWLRLLFGREFALQELMILWDGIFADDPSLCLCEWICVAMLMAAKREVIGQDFSMVLHRLMKQQTDGTGNSAIFYLNSARNLRSKFLQAKTLTPGDESPSRRTFSSSNMPQSSSTTESNMVGETTRTLSPAYAKKRAIQPWATPITAVTTGSNSSVASTHVQTSVVNSKSFSNTPSAANSTGASSSSLVASITPAPGGITSLKPPAIEATVDIPPGVIAPKNGFSADEARVRECLAKVELEIKQREERDIIIIRNLRRYITALSGSFLGSTPSQNVLDALQGLRSIIADLGGEPYSPNIIGEFHDVNASDIQIQSDGQPVVLASSKAKTSTEVIVDAIDDFLSSEATLPPLVQSSPKSPLKSSPFEALPPLAPIPASMSSHYDSDVWPAEIHLDATLKQMATPSMSSLNSIIHGDESNPWGGKSGSNEQSAVEAMMKGWARWTTPNNNFLSKHEKNSSMTSSGSSPPSPSKFFDSVLSTVSCAATNAAVAISEGIEKASKGRDPFSGIPQPVDKDPLRLQ